MTDVHQKSIRLAAVGDLLLTAKPGDSKARGLEALSDEVRELFASCDLVFANLECTLVGKDSVPTEPLVLSTEKQIRSLKGTGIDIVTLGNNHSFDCFDDGFGRVTSILDDIGIPWFGAGVNLSEALRPIILERNGVSLAFMGVVDQSSGPYQFARETGSGVAPLALEQTCNLIKKVKKNVDHVVISPHWGMERFRIPSPMQVQQAHRFVEAGASLVLGHHPHVIQGIETWHGSTILYSLGNFQANEVHWQNDDILSWSRFERTGMILLVDLAADGVLNVQQIPVFDDGTTIDLDTSFVGDRYFRRANRLLQKGVTEKSFQREKFYIQVVKPLLSQMKWSRLKRFRPGHFSKLAKLLLQSK